MGYQVASTSSEKIKRTAAVIIMMARTHVIFGAGAAVVAGQAGWASISIATILAGMLGSLLPDIDHPKSAFGSRVWPLSWLVSELFGHRGITHSLLAVAGIAGLLFWWLQVSSLPGWALCIAIGYLSHLVADWLTPAGVPLMWPSKTKYRSPLTVKTGGAGEVAISLLVIAGIVLSFISPI